MTGSKTYSLRVSLLTKIMFLGVPSLMVIAGLAIPFAEPTTGSPPPFIFSLFWFGFLAIFFYQVLSIPQSIIHQPDEVLEFKAPLRTRRVPIGDLRAIEPVPNQFGMLRFRHANGKITVLNQFDGFHQLIADIKARNPGIELRGC